MLPPQISAIEKLLSQMGITTKGGRLKLGHGLSGNMTTIAIVAVVGCAVLGSAAQAWPIQAACLAVIAGISFYTLRRVERIGRERPEIALLEGAELLLWQQQRLNLRTKRMAKAPQEPSEPYHLPSVAPTSEQIEKVEAEASATDKS